MLVKSTEDIDWDSFLEYYSGLDLLSIEVFPIPKELGFEYDGLGVSVHRGHADKKNVMDEIMRFVKVFESEPYSFKFTELYNGNSVSSQTVASTIDGLLPG